VSAQDGAGVRVRFCPSPTGNPHVGLVRTALFNWAFARHNHGVFVLRIEDTDAARDSEESYQALLAAMRWLGLDWDEGPEVGGPHGPYRQSLRAEIYADVASRLREAGFAYDCYCSAEELEAQREAARAAGRPPGYDGHCRELTRDQIAVYQAEGRAPVLRLRMPDRDTVFTDLVRGELTFGAAHVPDYVLVRANGKPLYPLVNPVDDALMGITHVLRGEDLLSSTPRQIALYEALAKIGVGSGLTPAFGHLPYVMGQGNRKLSKRDPEASLNLYRERGFLPEGLLNYLALLGWSMGEDRELFSLDEMVWAFDLSRVSVNPARFDLKKCEAVNAVKVRELSDAELAERIVPYLRSAGLVGQTVTPEQRGLINAATPLVRERMTVLSEAAGMLGFLLTDDASFAPDPADAAAVLTEQARGPLTAALAAVEDLPEFTAAALESALRAALVDGLGLKPRHAFTPVRVAVTGRKVSPPLFESMELLGRDRVLARLRAAARDLAG
jgi:glutamyl-tRNA synthetase